MEGFPAPVPSGTEAAAAAAAPDTAVPFSLKDSLQKGTAVDFSLKDQRVRMQLEP